MRTLALAAFLLASSAQAAVEFSVFINGDNDLFEADASGQVRSAGERIFELWTRIAEGAPDGFRFHLYFDNNDTLAGRTLPGTTLRRYRDRELVQQELLAETNSAEISALALALPEGAKQDGDLRVLILWGHGNGWRAVQAADHSHPGTAFDPLALAPLARAAGIDVLVFDACAMGYLEVLASLEGSVPYVIASQFELPVPGISYSGMLESWPTTALSLYRVLSESTRKAQAEAGVYAPLVLYRTQGVSAFKDAFNGMVEFAAAHAPEEWNEIMSASRPRCCRGTVLDDTETLDVRALGHQLKRRFGYDPAPIGKAFAALSEGGYGSVQFFLPSDWGTIPSETLRTELRQTLQHAWTDGLANWRLAREWLNEKRDPQ